MNVANIISCSHNLLDRCVRVTGCFFLSMLFSVERAAHRVKTYICKGACNTTFTVMEPFSALASAVSFYLQYFLRWHNLLAGAGDLCQRAGAEKERGGSAGSAASSFNRAQTFHTSLRLIIPRDGAQELKLYILSDKCK